MINSSAPKGRVRSRDAAAKRSEGGQGIQKGEAVLKDSDQRDNLGV